MSDIAQEERGVSEPENTRQAGGDDTGGAGDDQGSGDSGQADSTHHNDPDDMVAKPGDTAPVAIPTSESKSTAAKKNEEKPRQTGGANNGSGNQEEQPSETDGVLQNSDTENTGVDVLAATGLAAIAPAFDLVSRDESSAPVVETSVYEQPDEYASTRKTDRQPTREANRSDAARGGGSEAETTADEELKSPFKSAAHDQNKNGGYRVAGEVDPNITEDERRKRQQQVEDQNFARIQESRDAEEAGEEKAGFRQSDDEPGDEAETGGPGKAGYLGYGAREITDYELRQAIMKAVTKKDWNTLYFYKGNQIDPVLTARAEQMLAKLQGPKGPLAGREVQVSRLPMRTLEPWKWDLMGMRAARHEKRFDQKFGGPESDIANRHAPKASHDETVLESSADSFKKAADPKENAPEVISPEPTASGTKVDKGTPPVNPNKNPAMDFKGP